MDLAHAERAAAEISAVLAPACLRLEVAGSIRRRKETNIHDVELVAIPRPAPLVFGQAPPLSQLHALVDRLMAEDRMYPRLDIRGRRAWGPKYRRAMWRADGPAGFDVALDLFITTAEQWGVIFLLRTGDAEFSKTMVTTVPAGVLPRGFKIDEGRVWRGDAALDTLEESDVFDALGLPWITPAARTRNRLLAVSMRPLE